MPVLLVGSMAMTTWNLATPPHSQRAKSHLADPNRSASPTLVATEAASRTADDSAAGQVQIASVTPSTYTVVPGDTVSGIAGRYGLSTASVLALNGLSWKSLIFPRQVLRLTSAARPVAAPPTTKAPAAPAPTTLASDVTTRYTIVRGDTVTAIARKFGLTVQAILTANGLVASSIIYAGRTLNIPGATRPASTAPGASGSGGTQPAQVGSSTVVLSASMSANASIIIAVGRSRGVPSYGLVVALAAAMQESGLENLNYGDRDSVGLFQQRPSAGWGSVAQLENPTYAAELFFGGPSNPNKGNTRGLLDIPGWQSMTVTQAAQAVQVSATPNAYAKWEASARAWLAQLG
jgi:LysM repeat protein